MISKRSDSVVDRNRLLCRYWYSETEGKASLQSFVYSQSGHLLVASIAEPAKSVRTSVIVLRSCPWHDTFRPNNSTPDTSIQVCWQSELVRCSGIPLGAAA